MDGKLALCFGSGHEELTDLVPVRALPHQDLLGWERDKFQDNVVAKSQLID